MRYARPVRRGTALVALLISGCLQSPLVPCGNKVCPSGSVCAGEVCATPGDVEVCEGLVDGEACRATNGADGTCQAGVCQTGLCGNGEIDAGEVCDDNNKASGDGCRGDCLKQEACPDGVIDQGERCDDGNGNAADGCDTCRLTTWSARSIVGTAVMATTIAFANPAGVAADDHGRIYIADTSNHRIRRIETDGSLTTLAGTGVGGPATGDGGAATSAQLNQPGGVAVDGVGNVYFSDSGNHRLRRIDVDGTITTIAGNGQPGSAGDGGAASLAQLSNPNGVAVDGLGRIFIADTDNHRVRRIDVDGTIATVAGTGNAGYNGDGIAATSAELQNPYGVAVDATGRLLIADSLNHRVRRIDDDTIATVAGTGTFGYGGDGGPATDAMLAAPAAVAVDATGRILIADSASYRIRRIENGTISTIAGTGTAGFSGDGAAATAAELSTPAGVAVDGQGVIAIADMFNQRIRQVAADGTISTVGGTGALGFGGDAREATSALLKAPFATVIDAQGRIYVSDTLHQVVRRIELDGTIETVAGTGIAGDSGDGGPATSAQLSNPNGLAIDAQGRLVIADVLNNKVKRVENGIITTIAGTGSPGSTGDTGPATSAKLFNPNDVAIDPQGRVLIADTYNSKIRRIETDGTIVTVAGTGLSGYDGDHVQAMTTRLAFPYYVGVDGAGRILIADTSNHRVRRVALDGTITTIAGTGVAGSSGAGGLATSAQLDGPQSIREDSMGRLVFVDGGNHMVRRIELDGTITTIAGAGVEGARGDGGPAANALFARPHGLALDSMDRIYVADSNNDRIRCIADGTITTVAGRIAPERLGPVSEARFDDPQAIAVTPTFTLVAGGSSGTLEASHGGRVDVVAGRYPQETATATLARFRTSTFGSVGGTVIDEETGLVYITETSANRIHVITRIDPNVPSTWTMAPLANTAGIAGAADGDATTARFRSPTGLFLDSAARLLYIADTGNHAIRVLDLTSHSVSTFANTSYSFGFGGDGASAATARLYRPTAITRCKNGDVFIADTGNNRVRRIDPAMGLISSVLGDGVPASSGEGAPASTFPVDGPRGLACDEFGNLFVTSTTTVRLLTANGLGVVDGTGDVQTIYGKSPRDKFPSNITSCLTALAVTGPSTVQIADACTGLLVELTRTLDE